jgi:hypothetical protein
MLFVFRLVPVGPLSYRSYSVIISMRLSGFYPLSYHRYLVINSQSFSYHLHAYVIKNTLNNSATQLSQLFSSHLHAHVLFPACGHCRTCDRAGNFQREGKCHEYESHVMKVWPTVYPRVWRGLHLVHQRKPVLHCY